MIGNDYKIIKASDIKDWNEQASPILKKSIVMDYEEIGDMSEKDEGTYRQWLKIYLKDPNFIYLLYFQNEFVGYLHCVILTDEASKKMLSGQMQDSDLRSKHIIYPYKLGHYNLYCVCICMKKEHQNKGLGTILFNALMLDINKLKDDNIVIDSIIADAYPRYGKKFFKKHGFIFTDINVGYGEIAFKKLN